MKLWLKTLLGLRPHFFAALAMFLAIAFLAEQPDKNTRVLLIAPIAVFFIFYAVLFALEYEHLSQKKPVKIKQGKRNAGKPSRRRAANK